MKEKERGDLLLATFEAEPSDSSEFDCHHRDSAYRRADKETAEHKW